MIEVLDRINIVPKEEGRYAAFPTLVRLGDCVLLACRQGNTNSNRPHGEKGKVFLLSSKISDLKTWESVSIGFQQSHAEGNELDAIISLVGEENLMLVSRHYRSGHENYPYISHVHLNDIRGSDLSDSLQIPRYRLNDILSEDKTSVTVAAVFGHVLTAVNNDQFMSCYAVVEEDSMPSPTILRSSNNGINWHFHSTIVRSDIFGSYLNETSLLQFNDGRTLSVIRTDKEPWPLYFSFSNALLTDWSPISETGLYGHAPMLVKGEKDDVFLFYRDLEETVPGVSCAIYSNGVWRSLGSVMTYENIYNGGYSDAIYLGENHFFMVTYLDDKDECPWIDGFIIKVDSLCQ